MPTTPNMNLLLPDPTITPGPTYASENNTAFSTIDSHDHTTGKGLPIPTAALNINADVTFNSFNIEAIRAARFDSQTANLTLPADINQLYVVNGNLVYNNNLGQAVQITSGAAIDATSIGGIGGDYATSTALVFYTSADKTFTLWSNTNTPASIDAGNLTIRNDTLNSFGITLAPDPSIASNYQLTLPAALPSATSAMEVDPSGNITYGGGVNPSGAIVMYGGAAAPSGWLLCDGTSYLRTTYPALFTAIGTAYGAADSTHFNVPDFRGIFPRGVDGGAGNDPDASSRIAAKTGGNIGDNVGSYQADDFLSHAHTYVNNNNNPGSSLGVIGGVQSNGISSPSSSVSGGGPGNETRPKNLYVNFIVKI